MRVVIAGGTGLLGSALTKPLASEGHDVVVLSRRPDGRQRGVRHVAWSPDGTVGPWAREIDGADAVINLAGAGIADRRWTPARKALLRSSRIDSTRSLAAAVSQTVARPATFIQGSAVGYYGASLSDRPHDESSAPGSDFLARLAVEWEHAAMPVAEQGTRLVVVRTGIVLSRDGGALPPMARPFRFFVGGPIGSGRQYLSWIAIEDWVSLVRWALATPVSGPVNAVAPAPVTNREFAAVLARVLGRPNLVAVPAFALRLAFGEMADVMLVAGQRVLPTRALAGGFAFAYPELEGTLARHTHSNNR